MFGLYKEGPCYKKLGLLIGNIFGGLSSVIDTEESILNSNVSVI
jgi:hypothetical protein